MSGIMDLLGGDIVKTVGSVITDLVTTDKERIQLGLDEQKIEQGADLAQVDVNKAEAQSARFWVAGWRPGIGWVGVVALFCAYVPKCLMLTGIWSYQAIALVWYWKVGTPMPNLPAFPDLGLGDLLGMLAPMLGIGYMRHKEKLAGVAATGIGDVPASPSARPQASVAGNPQEGP